MHISHLHDLIKEAHSSSFEKQDVIFEFLPRVKGIPFQISF